jgi:hypothetical protein
MKLINILIYWKQTIKLNLLVRKEVYFIKLNINNQMSLISIIAGDSGRLFEGKLLNNKNQPKTKGATNGKINTGHEGRDGKEPGVCDIRKY